MGKARDLERGAPVPITILAEVNVVHSNNGLIVSVPLSGPSGVNRTAPGA
jgi:hypothetical protein